MERQACSGSFIGLFLHASYTARCLVDVAFGSSCDIQVCRLYCTKDQFM